MQGNAQRSIMKPIILFTDFGWDGPYVGHVKARLWQDGHRGPVIDLQHDAPAFNPHAAGHLLAAQMPHLPEDAVIIAVIDPGVGSRRKALAVATGGRWFVGPDNGLFDAVFACHPRNTLDAFDLTITENAAATFHGRDVFAPAAALLAQGQAPKGTPLTLEKPALQDRAPEVIYIDAYGNVMTTIDPQKLAAKEIMIKGHTLPVVRTFSDVAPGQAFCYVNSLGLVEIAINQGHAAKMFDLKIGTI